MEQHPMHVQVDRSLLLIEFLPRRNQLPNPTASSTVLALRSCCGDHGEQSGGTKQAEPVEMAATQVSPVALGTQDAHAASLTIGRTRLQAGIEAGDNHNVDGTMYRQHPGEADPFAARQKEEQRRRQQAYAQALAQQVQQRELQKQHEKELDRQGTSHGRSDQRLAGGGGQQLGRSDGFGDTVGGRGFWDGFGEKANPNRTNFARGQRQPAETPRLPRHQEQQQQVSPLRQATDIAPALHDPSAFAPNHALGGFQHGAHSPSHHYQDTNHFRQPHPHVSGNGMLGEFDPSGPPPLLGHRQGFAQPVQLNSMFPHGGAPASLSDWGAPLQHQQPFVGHHENFTPGAGAFHHQLQQQQQHYEQQSQPHQHNQHNQPPADSFDGHRGLRQAPSAAGTLGFGGSDDDSKARRKQHQHQQLEIQAALQKQIDEKNRQKLEAKRRQEEEDRREVERFEAEQRRTKLEEEKAKEVKRRKAAEELAREQQAAAALAHHQKKAQHSQQQAAERRQENRPSPVRPLDHTTVHESPQQMRHVLDHQQPSPQKMDPFVNTRAHLFEDTPGALSSAQTRHGMMVQQQLLGDLPGQRTKEDRHQQLPPFSPEIQDRRRYVDPTGQEGRRDIGTEDRGWQAQHHPGHEPHHPHNNTAMQSDHSRPFPGALQAQVPFVDPAMLLRQYDEVREELMNQRRIVDQLRQAHAEIQQQQRWQQPPANASSPSPTLSDLEQLRFELREELEHRERLHRQELEKLRLQQDRRESLPSPRGSAKSSQPVARAEPSRAKPELSRVERSLGHSSSFEQPLASVAEAPNQEHELGSTSSQAPISEFAASTRRETPLASLPCDSKLVYFDSHVKQPQLQTGDPHATEARSIVRYVASRKPVELVLHLEDSADEERLTAPSVAIRDSFKAQQRGDDSVAASQVAGAPRRQPGDGSAAVVTQTDDAIGDTDTSDGDGDTDSEHDTLTFFIKDLRDTLPLAKRRSPGPCEQPVAHRYASWELDADSDVELSIAASPPMASRVQWLSDEDDGDEANASLTGEELEAIFQRNVRRHEILRSFQSPSKRPGVSKRAAMTLAAENPRVSFQEAPTGRVLAWTYLHHQLEANATTSKTTKTKSP